MNRNVLSFVSFLCLLVFLTACSKDHLEETAPDKGLVGFAQKGPFINGASILVSELDDFYAPTGRVFSTQVFDNSGAFQLDGVELDHQLATLRVDGFYFNEVCGGRSDAQITLHGIVDHRGENPFHINVLTHLEKARVEYLLSQDIKFTPAKEQAQAEVLAVFGITPANPLPPSDQLNFTQNGEGNAILLAVSALLQGYRSEAELSELMARIIADIRTDGVLNDISIGSSLRDHSFFLDAAEIRNNLIDYFAELNVSATVPDISSYISAFVSGGPYPFNQSIFEYPAEGKFNLNILDTDPTTTTFTAGEWYSLAATPPLCNQLRINLRRISGGGSWGRDLLRNFNWLADQIDPNTIQQNFTAVIGGECHDLRIRFTAGTYLIQYFEKENLAAVRTKTITVN
ncbi:MAG: hypothetical protein AAGG75_10680 [Bacteroidota bacterium]